MEAKALCRVEHPNVARFYALAVDEAGGVMGLAMEHVDGASLDARIAQKHLPVMDTLLGARVRLVPRLMAGALIARSKDTLSKRGAAVFGDDEILVSASLLLSPAIGVEITWGRFYAGGYYGGLYQYDLSQPTLAAVQASEFDLGAAGQGQIQRGPDGRMYIASVSSGTSLHTIDNPNSYPATVTFNSVQLAPGTTFYEGLPNPVPGTY